MFEIVSLGIHLNHVHRHLYDRGEVKMSASVMTTTRPGLALSCWNIPLRIVLMLHDLISMAGVHQCTFHMHKSHPTIMLDSCPHYNTTTNKSKDLLHAVWSIVFRSTSIDTCTYSMDMSMVVAVSKMTHPDVSILSGNVSLWRPHLDLTLSVSVVLHRAHKVESVRQEMAKWLTTTCWAGSVCNLPMALSRWADVNLGIIAFLTVSLCGLLESLLVCQTKGWYGMQSYRTPWCTYYWVLRFCVSLQSLCMATFMRIELVF